MADPTSTLNNPNKDGGLVMRSTAGSGKGSIYMLLPKYQFIATGAYQWRWGINFGVNYVARQGFAEPFNRTRTPGSADETASIGKTVLLVENVDDFLLPMVHSFDGRISKQFRVNRFTANFDVDLFNLFNASTELGRKYHRRLTTFNTVREIMNPRIVRFGIRMGF